MLLIAIFIAINCAPRAIQLPVISWCIRPAKLRCFAKLSVAAAGRPEKIEVDHRNVDSNVKESILRRSCV